MSERTMLSYKVFLRITLSAWLPELLSGRQGARIDGNRDDTEDRGGQFPAQQTPATTRGLQMAPAVSEKREKIETGTTDATIADTDRGLKIGGETEVDPEAGQRSPVRSGATQEKEGGGDIKTENETGQEIGVTGNGAGVERSTGRAEVDLNSTRTRTRTRTPPRSSKPPRSRSPPSKAANDRAPPTGPRGSTKISSSKPPLPTADSSPKSAPKTNGTTSSIEPSKTQENDAMKVDADSDPEMAEMRKAMGFTGFKSTKNTKVKGNNVSGMRKEKKTEYRQYMNRVGGFNRPLSPSR
ncbi:MAG: hypothetical protein Q9175_007958 [Cornicularia normoerica]